MRLKKNLHLLDKASLTWTASILLSHDGKMVLENEISTVSASHSSDTLWAYLALLVFLSPGICSTNSI